MGIPDNGGMGNPGVVIALTAGTANLLMAAIHFAIARAPGWRIARLFAGMALTAGLYNILNAVYCIAGMSDAVYLAAGRLSYLVGTVQAVLWLVYAYSDGNGSLRKAPRSVRWVAASAGRGRPGFRCHRVALKASVSPISVAWAGVSYSYPLTTALGDVYGFLVLALPAAAVLQLDPALSPG